MELERSIQGSIGIGKFQMSLVNTTYCSAIESIEIKDCIPPFVG